MKNTFLKTTVRTFLALLMLFGCTQFFVSGQESETGNSPEEQIERARPSIVGAWRTAVTLRNCQTGLPVAPVGRGLLTFNKGGTLSEYNAGPGSSPAMRSPGHGVWAQNDDRDNYSLVFIINRYSASGVFIGTQKVTAALELGAIGASGNLFTGNAVNDFNTFTTNAAVEVFDAGDNLIGRGCATAVGTRIQ